MEKIFPRRERVLLGTRREFSQFKWMMQGKAGRVAKAREGFASPLSLHLRIRIKVDGLLLYHSISSSGSPRLLVAFSSGAGSRIPHLMSDRSKVVLQVDVKICFYHEILSTLANCTAGH